MMDGVRVPCRKHGNTWCYVQEDGSHITPNRCKCRAGTFHADCPVDAHRILARVPKAQRNAQMRALRIAWIGGPGFTREEFKVLCEKYDNRCLCCGEKRPLIADHVIPVAKGGSNSIANIQPLCRHCNNVKTILVIDFRKAENRPRFCVNKNRIGEDKLHILRRDGKTACGQPIERELGFGERPKDGYRICGKGLCGLHLEMERLARGSSIVITAADLAYNMGTRCS